MAEMIIQFICRGNAFRSIIAEAYLNSLRIPGITVLSSGTVASKYRNSNEINFSKTLSLLKKHEIKEYAKSYYADDLNQSSLNRSGTVVCLNKRVYDEAASSFKLPEKTYVWNVADLGEKDALLRLKQDERHYQKMCTLKLLMKLTI